MKQLIGIELKRFVRKMPKHNKEIVLIAENIQYAMNVGSLFRLMDAVKITKLFLTGISKRPPNKTISDVGRNKHKVVNWEYVNNTEDVIKKVKSEGYEIIALEITDESILYTNIKQANKIAVVIGNETYGIVKSTLALCDKSVYIPMYGKGKSLNVHVSAAVFLYYLISQ
jgi:23S rRNA (guanosine2251-2'-O)-methyltransferase